ncbi:glutaminase [Epidermidibacterium keratini]|uniref:Glutaminase n=1 Tax=Epidermidibacterium keratini TaxID=1891644 RepID=A0A7L4YNS8_9ACTN|nr:glutaminase [Epidermidibacterium keratini]QHC00796.1 glutaminase [Epidermidibacterium keratini]
MQTPVPGYLAELLESCDGDSSGEPAAYIPELARADVSLFGVAVAAPDGVVYAAGDADVPFTIQSISKPFAYALALQDRGCDFILSKVGTEPSGDAFNMISLESGTGRPRNPMINIGAITTHALTGDPSMDPQQRFERVRDGLSAFAGRRLEVDEAVFDSEMSTADRNRSLAFMVRSYGIIDSDPIEAVHGYTRQCSLLVTAKDLAVMGATLANAGVNPLTGERVVDQAVVRQVLSVMLTCGMYDAAGDWVTTVGIPAKSGVAGGILGALPGQVGIGAFSPPLDEFGNSVRGVQVCQRLSGDMGLHLMGAATGGPVTVREVVEATVDGDPITVVRLQGDVHYTQAERSLRVFSEIEPGDSPVAIDVSRTAEFNDVGRRMILEGIRRLGLDGHPVTLVDPDGVLPDPHVGDGPQPTVVQRLALDS